MIYPVSSCRFTEEMLCKSLRALKGALSHDAFRYHLNPCNPSKSSRILWLSYNNTHSLQLLFPPVFVSMEENFSGKYMKGIIV